MPLRIAVLACLLALAALPGRADAAQVIITPVVVGPGALGGGTACNFATVPNSAVNTCPIVVAGNPVDPFTPTIVSLTAIDRPNQPFRAAFTGWANCPAPTANVCTVTVVGFNVFPFTIVATFSDTTGPAITNVVANHSATVDRQVTFGLAENDGVASRKCSMDGAALGPCPANLTYVLPEGTHTFAAQSTDQNGNVGPASAPLAFRVLDTQVVDGPADVSSNRTPTFTYSTIAGLTFECAVDAAAFTSCGSRGPDGRASLQLPSLADGAHTFRVRAKDGPDIDHSPRVRTWTIDTVAPIPALDPLSGPGQGALQAVNTETFAFGVNEPSDLACSLDGAPFTPCVSPITYSRLLAGPHSFRVQATDRAGNVAESTARSWVVAANDDDDDGFNARVDCNDASAAIHPGAVDTPGNGVDENCDGADTRLPKITVTLSFFARAGTNSTRFTRLQVKGVPRGSTVTVTCKGRGCPKGLKAKGYTKRNAAGTVSLGAFIKKAIPRTAAITVTVSRAGSISAVKIIRLRRSKSPQIATRCQAPGARAPSAC